MRGNLHVRFLGGGDDFQYQVRFWDPLALALYLSVFFYRFCLVYTVFFLYIYFVFFYKKKNKIYI
jgi:hypothetical protein